ncbi:MAG TPA: sialidase family protein [Actinomycetota bacterium]|nr:sialidase family protein [Actinomycetota bacterium]
MPALPSRPRLVPFVAGFATIAVVVAASALGGSAAAAPSRGGATAVRHVYHAGTSGTSSQEIAGYHGPRLTLSATKVGAPGMEPTIGVSGDGTVYFGAAHLVIDTDQTYGGARTDTRMSTDGGRTFTSIQPGAGDPATLSPANLDPMIYVDPSTGRVFNFDLEGACNFLNYSDDKGASWTTNPLACGNIVVDHQTIVTAKPTSIPTVGYPNVVYWCSNRVADSTCGRSLDGGITWTATGTPAYTGYDPAAGGLCGGLTGHLAADPYGRIFLPKGHCGHPWVAISDDEGTTWTRVQVSNISAADTHLSVASDNAGNLYFGWWGGPHHLPFLAISRDHGKTWSKPMMIAPPGVKAANLVTVAAGAPGRVAVTFLSTTDPNKDKKRPMDQTVVVSTNALSSNPVWLSSTANRSGDPVHRGNDCTSGRCGGIWDFLDIHISKTGRLWASESDDCVATCVTEQKVVALHAGKGYAVTDPTGPTLGTPFQYAQPSG